MDRYVFYIFCVVCANSLLNQLTKSKNRNHQPNGRMLKPTNQTVNWIKNHRKNGNSVTANFEEKNPNESKTANSELNGKTKIWDKIEKPNDITKIVEWIKNQKSFSNAK